MSTNSRIELDIFSSFVTEWIFFYLKKVKKKPVTFLSSEKSILYIHMYYRNPLFPRKILQYIKVCTYKYHSVAYVHHGHVFFLVTYVEYSLMYLVPFLQMK